MTKQAKVNMTATLRTLTCKKCHQEFTGVYTCNRTICPECKALSHRGNQPHKKTNMAFPETCSQGCPDWTFCKEQVHKGDPLAIRCEPN